MFRNKLRQMKNIDDIFSNPSSTSDAVSQADVKMFHPIYKAHANEQNLNNCRMKRFSNHQPKSNLIAPHFLQQKERRSNTRLAMRFCFVNFNGTCNIPK
ncbi:hypothetical protein AVEN_227957-1 [Araneus ventricosus]|uniref:Uncharacterized protein n=1 Tax=Araneus ventricosus TaxID=182803 RepID=A0A4Y2NKU0_ARAVE|nr:hypothetical protein AVEN_227957-1 [Araneus ventricosus]